MPEEDVAAKAVPDAPPFAFTDTVVEEEGVAAGAVPGVLSFAFADTVPEEEEEDGVPDEDSFLQPDSEKQDNSRNAAMKVRKKVEFLGCLGNGLLTEASFIDNLWRV